MHMYLGYDFPRVISQQAAVTI